MLILSSRPPVSELRAAFETWYTSTHTGPALKRTAKGYTDNVVRVAWRAWQQAARLYAKPNQT